MNKNILLFLVTFIFPLGLNAQSLELWNKNLELVSGSKDCPLGNLISSKVLKSIKFSDREFVLTDGITKVQFTGVPGCEEKFKTIYNASKNEITKVAVVDHCLIPTDNYQLTETLRMNFAKKTLKYSFLKTKTANLKQKFVCRYTFR